METHPASSLQSLNPEIVDHGINPMTLQTATILDKPSSLDNLLDELEEFKDDLVSEDPPPSQYLLVRRIPASLFSALVKHADVPKGVRATIIHPNHEILYKVVPYPYHEKISGHFIICISEGLGLMGLRIFNDDFWLGGAGRVTGRICDKEPSSSFYPGAPTPREASSWPSLVLEAGLPGSVPQLRTDAQWWYANSHQQTKIVVVISAEPNSRDADIEIWTDVGPRTRSQTASVLRCAQSARVRDGMVSGDALVIDFWSLMRRPPQNHQETDLQLSPLWIEKICK